MEMKRLSLLAGAAALALGLSSGAYAFPADVTQSYSKGENLKVG